jgi:uncharacterized membrane protein
MMLWEIHWGWRDHAWLIGLLPKAAKRIVWIDFLLLFYLASAVSGMIGRKFRVSSFHAFGPGVWTCFWSALYLTYIISFLVVLEFILVHLYYKAFVAKNGTEPADVENVDRVRALLKQDPIPMNVNLAVIRKKLMSPAREKTRKRLGDNFPRCTRCCCRG